MIPRAAQRGRGPRCADRQPPGLLPGHGSWRWHAAGPCWYRPRPVQGPCGCTAGGPIGSSAGGGVWGRGPGIGPLGGLWPPHGPPCGPLPGALGGIDTPRLPGYKMGCRRGRPSRPAPLSQQCGCGRTAAACPPRHGSGRPPHAPTVGVVGADAPPPGLTARRLPHLRGTLPALPVGLRPVGRPGGGPPSAPPALWGLSAWLPPGLPPARLRARGPRPAAGAYGPLGRQCRRAGRRACAPHLCTGQGIAGGRRGAGPRQTLPCEHGILCRGRSRPPPRPAIARGVSRPPSYGGHPLTRPSVICLIDSPPNRVRGGDRMQSTAGPKLLTTVAQMTHGWVGFGRT